MNEKHLTPAEALAKALGVKEQALADWHNAPTVPPRLWTTQDLAEFTQRSVSSIEQERSAANDGRTHHPPYIRIGNAVRYDPATVYAYYQATQITQTTPGAPNN